MNRRLISGLALLSLVLSACLHVKYPNPGQPVKTAESEALVFGSIIVMDRGYKIEPWSFNLTEAFFAGEKPEIRLSIFRIESNQRSIYARIDSDGSFYWIVPSVTYLIYHSRIDQQPVNEPLAAFQVPNDAQAVYLGTMTMHIESNYNTGSGKQDYEVTTIQIEDEFDRAKQSLIGRHPDFTGTIVKHLLIYDPSLQELFQDYSKRECEKMLNRHGLYLLNPDARQKN
jgi:hypothetical protein